MKSYKKYLKYDYPIRVFRYPDGVYCAEIESIEGLCAYGTTPNEALIELESVKETAFELMLEQGIEPPVPVIHLEIPINVFEKFPHRLRLKQFVKA